MCSLQLQLLLQRPTVAAVKTLYNTADGCATATDGVITVTATGGTGTITLPKTTNNFQASICSAVSAAGTYQIKVRDANFRFCDCS
jgi:aspartate oxidase